MHAVVLVHLPGNGFVTVFILLYGTHAARQDSAAGHHLARCKALTLFLCNLAQLNMQRQNNMDRMNDASARHAIITCLITPSGKRRETSLLYVDA